MIYKDIPSYEGYYRIYKDGRIWSYRTKKFLTIQISKDGYKTATLCVNKKIKNQFLHRWLYLSFVGEIPAEKQINHKDGNKLNNELSNLELVTPKQNTQHAWGIGLARKLHGSKNSYSKLTEKDIPKIFKLYREGILQKEIAEMFGICQSNVSKIINNNTWTHEKVIFEKKDPAQS